MKSHLKKKFWGASLGLLPHPGSLAELHPPEGDRMLYFLGIRALSRASLGTVLPTSRSPILITVKIRVAKVFPLL